MKPLSLLLALGLLFGVQAARTDEPTKAAPPPPAGMAVATFAGGCFWCMEPPFDKVAGVVSTTSGYTGGTKAGATYREVSSGTTGHAEAVRVVYDPAKVSYGNLVAVFWRNVDPVDAGGQFCDRGNEYRTAIFVHDAEQRRVAEESKRQLNLGKPVVTQIVDAGPFYVAEDYHQDYYVKNPTKYRFYRWNCGRDARLQELWGKKEGS
jgi:peptide-methionine (S)-S-oxide reductase